MLTFSVRRQCEAGRSDHEGHPVESLLLKRAGPGHGLYQLLPRLQSSTRPLACQSVPRLALRIGDPLSPSLTLPAAGQVHFHNATLPHGDHAGVDQERGREGRRRQGHFQVCPLQTTLYRRTRPNQGTATNRPFCVAAYIYTVTKRSFPTPGYDHQALHGHHRAFHRPTGTRYGPMRTLE